MTLEEVVEKYAKVPLEFSSYYKFSFNYTGVAEDGAVIVASFGAGADDIYKREVSPGDICYMTTNPEENWHSMSVHMDAKQVFADWWY